MSQANKARQSREKKPRMNHQIRIREVRVIDQHGNNLGVMQTHNALAKAEDAGLDLIEVSGDARPPVCRIMDYGKYRYEQSVRERQSRKNKTTIHVKEIQIRPNIGEADFETKCRKAAKFLEAGDHVKVSVVFRGREHAHPELGKALMDRLVERLDSSGKPKAPAQLSGKQLMLIMLPNPKQS
jgi:translation initiation factor IF-3